MTKTTTTMTVAAVLATGWISAATAHKGSKKMAKLDPAHTQATLVTDFGDITIRFYADKAPHHVENFIELSEKHAYDGVLFHRVIPNFMIQTGDPLTHNPKTPRELMGTGAYTVSQKGNAEGFVYNTIRVTDADGGQKTETIRKSRPSSMTSRTSKPCRWRGRRSQFRLAVLHRRQGRGLPRSPVHRIR